MSAANLPTALLTPAGPHPAPADLRQYAAGTLPPAEQQRIEAHALGCERCADVLAGLALTDEATTDRAVAQLRHRLRARVTREPAAAVRPRLHWPRLAAAALVGGLLAGGLWGWEHRAPAPAPETVAVVSRPAPPVAAAPAAGLDGLAATVPATAEESVASADAVAGAEVAAVASPTASGRVSASPAAPAANAPASARISDAVAYATRPPVPVVEATPPASKPAADIAFQPPPTRPQAEAARREDSPGQQAEPAATEPPASEEMLAARQQARARAKAIASTELAAGRAAPLPPAPTLLPAPADGMLAMREYIRRAAAEFEPELNARHLSGTVRLSFIVGADGKLSEMKVTRGIREDYDNEAKRIIAEGPAWLPGVAGGRRAALPVELKVAF